MMTIHNIYAANKYKALIAGGMSERDAHYEVSRLLGHERLIWRSNRLCRTGTFARTRRIPAPYPAW